MKQLYAMLLVTAVILCPTGIFAQNTVKHEKCLADYYFQEEMARNPEFRKNQQLLETETAINVHREEQERQNGSQQKNASVVRYIPVVFHVIHEGGSENISREQCVSQIDSLNKDFRRLNFDAINTPGPFQSNGGDAEIEFRLATLDPDGNCTDGVTRTFSSLTNGARNNVKSLIRWPRNQYLNIWVVKTIENTSGGTGIILGFAQFPGGPDTTDGVVMRHDVVGTIGTASATFNNNGRTATHEIGHWLNLRHIWGDSNCGSDFVVDTPTAQEENYNCPAFPHVTCNNGPNGDMFSNYMDYTDGACQNIFSNGQCTRMNTALSSSVSQRNNLWSAGNLVATGTTGAPGAICTPIATFYTPVKYICEGTTVDFTDGSWNGTPDTWFWDFPGGTPSTSTDQNPTVQYNTAGTYDVTLTVTNASGSDSHTEVATIIVFPLVGQNAIPFQEGFEIITFPGSDWLIENESANSNTWAQTSSAAFTGTQSIYVHNHTNNPAQSTDVFVTPSYNFSNITNANMTFQLAFAPRTATVTDQLKVWASTTCGQLWSIRYNKTGAALPTTGIVTSSFIPNASQWRMETVNLATASYNNKPNVRFKFDYLQNGGNNIYIDDINISGTVGLNEVMEASLDFVVYPNPVISKGSIEFTLTERQSVRIDVIDVLGRVVNEISQTELEAGEYQFELPADLASGLYSVRLNANGYVTSRKVIVN